MLRSLRLRLLLLTAFVAGTALVTVALLSRQAVRSEYGRLEIRDRAARLSGVAEILSERARRTAGLADANAVLERIASSMGEDFLLLGPDGAVLAASTPELLRARVETGPGNQLSVVQEDRSGRTVLVKRTVLVGAVPEPIRGPDGALVGMLYPHPRTDDGLETAEPRFLRSVNRWLLYSAVGSGALALLLTLALSRRILGPVESLTTAARRMGTGDLSTRVAVRSRDEIGELARAFNAMAEALERNEALRRSLVNDVAHELRTPLTNLRCQIEAIQDSLLEATPEIVRSLHEETLLLGRLVNDLQDLALAEAGRLPLERATVEVTGAIEAALASIRPRAAERGIELRAEVASALAVDADRQRLGQILRNLLANAITHTSEGGAITVEGRAQDGFVALAVRDTGPGIPPEHLPHVFDRFYRADPSRARASGGAGLGLAIVKELVEAHGGRVRAENAPGRGAVFTFTMPAARSS